MHGIYERDGTSPTTVYEKGLAKRPCASECVERMGRVYDDGAGNVYWRYPDDDVEAQLFTLFSRDRYAIRIFARHNVDYTLLVRLRLRIRLRVRRRPP